MIKFVSPTTQAAWEKINEYMIQASDKEISKYGGRVSSTVVLYDVLFDISKAWVDPDFDFAKLFGYHANKWNRLLSNYLSLDHLDLVKSQVMVKEKSSSPYNITYKFSNQHDSGKGCLISVVFQRRPSDNTRRLVVNIRSSEVTKRLIFDLLLVQRMGEYVYGEGVDLAVTLFCGYMWSTTELLVTYDIYKKLDMLIGDNNNPIATKIKENLKKLSDLEYAKKMKYKVHIRISRQLIAQDGVLGYKAKLVTLAKDCKLPEYKPRK